MRGGKELGGWVVGGSVLGGREVGEWVKEG